MVSCSTRKRTDLLYAEIEADPYVLDNIDSTPFVETPLHLAASVMQISFATEIMRLKPSFAQKLNPQGLSPIHLALQNRHYRMVLRFVDINKELIRVKGKDGITPLHMASQAGEIELLSEFLSICPKSIQDVTNQNQNALHLAVESRQFLALELLVRWLQCNCDIDAEDLEKSTLNCEDKDGNTVLHILVDLDNPDPEIVKLLLQCKIDVNAKNLYQSTALDILQSRNQDLNNNIRKMLVSAGARHGVSVVHITLTESLLPPKVEYRVGIAISVIRSVKNLSDSKRNGLLAAAALVGTMSFQASLSPPGGVFQINSENGPLMHGISSNSTVTDTILYAGTSVMNDFDVALFWIVNTVALLLSLFTIIILHNSRGVFGTLLEMTPLMYFVSVYFICMKVISPVESLALLSLVLASYFFVFFLVMPIFSSFLPGTLRKYLGKNSEMKSRCVATSPSPSSVSLTCNEDELNSKSANLDKGS
ncbi:hypothetical protein L6164_036960 [Bauhinia variegata]|uniref:Uncharacterized protein n=1 Tax=Bauhinia variegata TaxID=167791 RepID=A0ACB9KIS4_BAUVA|nr:hypothetical protein L6164_036960 [Bauhinia variegata]